MTPPPSSIRARPREAMGAHGRQPSSRACFSCLFRTRIRGATSGRNGGTFVRSELLKFPGSRRPARRSRRTRPVARRRAPTALRTASLARRRALADTFIAVQIEIADGILEARDAIPALPELEERLTRITSSAPLHAGWPWQRLGAEKRRRWCSSKSSSSKLMVSAATSAISGTFVRSGRPRDPRAAPLDRLGDRSATSLLGSRSGGRACSTMSLTLDRIRRANDRLADECRRRSGSHRTSLRPLSGRRHP